MSKIGNKIRAEAKVIEDEISAELRYQHGERDKARAALLDNKPVWTKPDPMYYPPKLTLWQKFKNFFTSSGM